MRLAIRGNKDAFGEIYSRYRKRLWIYVFKKCRDNDLAEDIVQDVFYKAYVRRRQFDPQRKFSSWIYQITHNEYYNWIRRSFKYRFESIDVLMDGQEFREAKLFCPRLIAGEEILKKEDRNELAQALRQLRPEYREALQKFYIEEKSYRAISKEMKMPTPTIGTFLSRARKECRKIMDQNEYNRIIGLTTEDVGSRKKLLDKVLQYARRKGYRRGEFYKMRKNQLKGIFYAKCI